jgi:transposase InsO family protein
VAYVELHDDEKAASVTAFVERALDWFEQRGITARRLMTDNAFSYVKNRSLGELLEQRSVRHLRTQPYRPRTNGKVERFHQTNGARVGLRTCLSLAPSPQPRFSTRARLLQRAQAAQLGRRPTADQPRSQRMWAGQAS